MPKLFLVCLFIFWSIKGISQIGCTDPLATNYDSSATENDGSCTYPASTIAPVASFELGEEIPETSGLLLWNDVFLTHNDDTDLNLYALDTANGAIIQAFSLGSEGNKDWEEITQDDQYFYLGDFGNNANGNRTDLHILRIKKNSLPENTPEMDTIFFSYADQPDFTSTGGNNTDFDCEAIIVSGDSLYLFSKQWLTQGTTCYVLPKVPGTHEAISVGSHNVEGLITGATFLKEEKVLILSGYSPIVQPFLYLLYDFEGNNFFSGNKRKILLNLPFHQVEGIFSKNGKKVYITNEKFVQPPLVNEPQQLHFINLEEFLGNYLDQSLNYPEHPIPERFFPYPNPTFNLVNIPGTGTFPSTFQVFNDKGISIEEGEFNSRSLLISLKDHSSGNYFIKLPEEGKTYRIVKY